MMIQYFESTAARRPNFRILKVLFRRHMLQALQNLLDQGFYPSSTQALFAAVFRTLIHSVFFILMGMFPNTIVMLFGCFIQAVLPISYQIYLHYRKFRLWIDCLSL